MKAVVLTLALSISYLSAQALADAPIGVPEYYLPSGVGDRCIKRFDLSGEYLHRREAVVSFVTAMHGYSDNWKSGDVVLGVDYARFSSFYLLYASSCANVTASVPAWLNHLFSSAPYTATEVSETPLIARTRAMGEVNDGPQVIARLFGLKRVSQCLIELDATDIPNAIESYKKLASGWQKYHFPFAGMTQQNESIYVLLGRQCDEKAAIYENVVFALTQDWPATGIGPVRVNLVPDPERYLEHEGLVPLRAHE